jgi:hypothetical protein
MDKILFISLLYFVVGNVLQQGQCSNTTFALPGQPCNSNYRLCKTFSVCNQTDGFCRSAAIGDYCQVSTDCFLSGGTEEGVRCVQNKCTKPRYSGYACTVNQHCFSNQCSRGRCVGRNFNDPCNPTNVVECDQNLFCSFSTKKCQRQLVLNETCGIHLENAEIDPRSVPDGSNFNILCKGGMMCMGEKDNKKCLWYRNGDVDTPCNFQRDRHNGCKFGLQCNSQTNKCYVHGGSTTPCPGETRGCSTNERCVCSGNNGAGKCTYTSGSNDECQFHQTAQKWLQCSIDYNCPLDSKNYFNRWLVDVFSPETCMGKNCGGIPKQYLCCALKNQAGNKDSEYQIGQIQNFCVSDSPLWIIFIILLTIALFVTVIFLFVGLFLAAAGRSSRDGFNEI